MRASTRGGQMQQHRACIDGPPHDAQHADLPPVRTTAVIGQPSLNVPMMWSIGTTIDVP
jgi:hypothetical protein